jgi:peptidyl-prolyl cis-trans isomerase C
VKWRRWAREPLVHFLAGGLLIFALFAWRGEPVDPASRTITIGRDGRAQLALGFERMMARPPTDAELDALTTRWVRDEVLYREALRLGLDEDDPVIRRRLAQKMDVIAASSAEAEQPSDAVLEAWLRAHPDRFDPGTAMTFDQLYFGDADAARAALERLRGGAEWSRQGRPASLPQTLVAAPRSQVASQFGERFAVALEEMQPGAAWRGPVETPLGYHLVRLRERRAGELPPLAKVRRRVEDDWRAETERDRKDAAYRLLRDAYTVEIER